MNDVYKEICVMWGQGNFLQALETVWKLDKVRFHYRELITSIPLRELVFRGCKQALELAKNDNAKAAGERLEALLACKPEALIIQDDEAKDKAWCRKFRLEMIRAHVLGALIRLWAGVSSSQKGGESTTLELVKTTWQALYMLDETATQAGEPDKFLLNKIARELDHPHQRNRAADADSRIHQVIASLVEATNRAPQIPPAFLRHLSREYLSPESGEGKPVQISFTLVRKQENQVQAFLARFLCERVTPGRGEVFIHPEQAFVPMDTDFRSLFFNVPRALQSYLSKSHSLPDSDVRMRLELLEKNKKLMPLQGNSASGAALRGAYFALTGKHLDKGILVMARLDANGNFRGVSSVRQKLQAVVESGQFNSLIIAQENLRETQEALVAMGKHYLSRRLGEDLDVAALRQDDYVLQWIPLAQ